MRVAIVTEDSLAPGSPAAVFRDVERCRFDGLPPQIYTIASGAWGDVRALARRMARDDVRLVHLAGGGAAAVAAQRVAARFRAPMVGSHHRWPRPQWRDLLTRSIYRGCARILVPSKAGREAYARCGYPADRLRLWPRGVDLSKFQPAHRKDEYRARWRVSDARPAILSMGRLEPGEEALMLAVIRILQEHGVAHRLIFVNSGAAGDTLARACDGIALNLTADELPDAFASADMFFFPSAAQSLGTAVLEAQASGLPAVVGDDGGSAELVRSGTAGYVCAAGDPFDFAWRLTQLLRDVRRRMAFGVEARKAVERQTTSRSILALHLAWREVLAFEPTPAALPVSALRA